MKKLLGIGALLVALALPSFAAAQVPIPVPDLWWGNGVYVQPVQVAGEVRGEWTVVACRIHINTLHGVIDDVEYESVGEVMTATVTTPAAEMVGHAEVKPRFAPGTRDVVAGRATFTVPAGATLVTTNTTHVVVGVCPSN